MATLKQLKSVKPNDYLETEWEEQNNAYYKVYKNKGKTLVLSNMFVYGNRPQYKIERSIKVLYNQCSKFNIISKDSKKAQTIEGRLHA